MRTKIKRVEKEIEAKKGIVGIEDILNQGLILDPVLIPIPGALDQGQGHIIEMIANPQTIQNSIGKKKEKISP